MQVTVVKEDLTSPVLWGKLRRRYLRVALRFASLLTVVLFVWWSLHWVERRASILASINENDNRLFTRFFNSLLNNEAVRACTNESSNPLHQIASPTISIDLV